MTCLATNVVGALRFAPRCRLVGKRRDCKGVTSVWITGLKFDICALGFSVPLDARHREVHFGPLAENVFGVVLREDGKSPARSAGLSLATAIRATMLTGRNRTLVANRSYRQCEFVPINCEKGPLPTKAPADGDLDHRSLSCGRAWRPSSCDCDFSVNCDP